MAGVAVVALLCRTSDRVPGGACGAQALAATLAGRVAAVPRIVGARGTARVTTWEEDLRDGRGCLLEAGGQLDDALEAGAFPVLLASDCSICVSTLPALVRRIPDVRILWLDAHADFHTPETTPSAFLGGMCLAGACGLWDTGFGAGVDPARVLMCGVRDVDAGERPLLDLRGVGRAEGRPSGVSGLLAGERVFVHLDLDVLDPVELPGAAFPAGGGFSLEGLTALLAEVAASADVVGAEITSFTAPQLAPRFAAALAPLLPREALR
ncbi:MAG TPA: arginase family protein [Solirubrobacteraceae bacterium]|nr:arginase family protein [Solirubrobacteraceae bacterium]